ncbi:MAG: RluA family pseudouridine synthase [Paenibacillus dendritiformis]|uniref:RluA family pseudouridine synthase n=1 Tax=Paenibacillus dendritiformis TaxID=130049 RepID=UPI00143CE519|nr:RluA family pseudouridine synthase [Paenibacillus dendritiformis]MDU5143172.1 RluA family pseudouridine synthase [Paenibacillus dendritiformis]NKI20732.1 RluA family pseudouridine synthase [Paenibacillus dendritiformis]NRF96790.1 RluA family pseudouridine synthase [Paenibacillus dendritiformis]
MTDLRIPSSEEENQEGLEQDALHWTVTEADAGERIDKYITEALEEPVSRSQVQIWIRDAHLLVNGRSVKPNYKVGSGDEIELRIPEPASTDIVPEAIPLDIYYEDADVIVINKPRGMVVHPAPGHLSGTVVNALMHHCRDLSGINGELRPGIVHRIDKDTSGLLMAAKNDRAHAELAAQLKAHTVLRKYKALVHGNLAHDQGTIDAPIGRDPHDRKMFAVTDRNSKRAVTHFQAAERFGDVTLVELQLETGRTHQIRVHMKYIGHPLVGDPMYTRGVRGVTMDGQALHAATLGFVHPVSGELLQFEAPLPDDMEHLLYMLRNR